MIYLGVSCGHGVAVPEVANLSVAASSVAICHACKNVCEVKEPREMWSRAKKGSSVRNDRLHSVTGLWTV